MGRVLDKKTIRPVFHVIYWKLNSWHYLTWPVETRLFTYVFLFTYVWRDPAKKYVFKLLLVVDKTLVPLQESILPDGMLLLGTNSRTHTIPKRCSNTPRWALHQNSKHCDVECVSVQELRCRWTLTMQQSFDSGTNRNSSIYWKLNCRGFWSSFWHWNFCTGE